MVDNIGIKVKNVAVLRGMFEHEFEPVLIDIACYVAEKHGVMITESFRVKLHPNDLHGTEPKVRALDLRQWAYPGHLAEDIEADINRRWIYDPSRPHMKCAWIHENRKTKGIHFHIQTHPKTRRVT